MLRMDPKQRYTVKQCLHHPWMKLEGPDADLEKLIKDCETIEVGLVRVLLSKLGFFFQVAAGSGGFLILRCLTTKKLTKSN